MLFIKSIGHQNNESNSREEPCTDPSKIKKGPIHLRSWSSSKSARRRTTIVRFLIIGGMKLRPQHFSVILFFSPQVYIPVCKDLVKF